MNRLDIRNVSNKKAAVATEAAQTGLGGNGGDEITATAAAQAWLVIRQRQQRDNIYCGRHDRGANLAWLGGSDKTDGPQQSSDDTEAIAVAVVVQTVSDRNGNVSSSRRRRKLGLTIAT